MLAEELGPIASSSGGLGDRKLTLTINFESTQGWVRSDALLDSTNSATWSKDLSSGIPYTPSTGRTFGPPTRPPMQPLAKRLSPSVKLDLKTRRLHRYSQAENALKKSMANLSETPPQELQIRILKQVAAALNAHAEEARANTHKLRALLSEGQVAPDEYGELKRQRWLEEKRQLTADQESKLVQDELELLIKGPPFSNENAAKIHEERRRANLFRFLASSTTRRPLQMRAMPRTTRTHRSTASETITTRLKLPQSIIDYLQSRARIKSLETTTTTIPALKLTRIRDSVALTFGVQPHITPPTREDSPVSASSATVSSSHSFGFSPFTESTMTAPNTAQLVADEELDQWDTLEGRAIIYKRYSLYRPKNEILAGMSQVTLPRYARDLIHEFEEESFDFHPGLGLSSRKHSISSDWELLTGGAVASTGHGHMGLSRMDHRPSSPDKPLVEATTPTKSKHTVLQKLRPTHRSAVSLVALSDSSLRLRETEDKQRLTRKLSLGLFSGRRPSTTDHETTAATASKAHADLLSFPSSPPINEEEEINEAVSPRLERPQRKLRNRLSLVFSRASTAVGDSATPMASTESLHSVLRATSPAETGAPAYASMTLGEKVRRKLPFSKH